MKVLHTVASLRPETGGPARSVPGLAAAVAQAGAEVSLWSPDVDGAPSINGVEILEGELSEVIRHGHGFDLIHDHGLWLPVNHRIAGLASRHGIPRMVSPRGMLEPWALNHRKWKKRAAWWLYQRGDLRSAIALHATADSEAEQFRRLGLKIPVHVIPNGIDLGLTTDNRQPATDQRTALFLSRIHPKKGLPMLVKAWSAVRPDGWRLKIVGGGEEGHLEEVKGLVRQADLQDEWEFIGPLEGDEKRVAFSEAQLFVLPTYSENFGIAVAEALDAGLPVITTTGAPWAGLIEHCCGWWIEPELDDLEKVLREATACQSEVLREMGIRGREWVRADFAWQGIGERMLAAYDQLLGSAN